MSSGLYVVENGYSYGRLDDELQQIDDRLFLSWEIDRRYDAKVYRVLYDRGDLPPAPICDWRDDYGRPLPLSSGLVELVKSLRPREGPDLGRMARANAEQAARDVRDFEDTVDEIAADVGPRISDKRSALLHRGVHLRRSRAKRGTS